MAETTEAAPSAAERERYYDEHVAPKLAEISKECSARGLSLLAVCEWSPGEHGKTLAQMPDSSFDFRLVEAATRCHGNIDALFIALMKYAATHGHGSTFLHRLGVPTEPARQQQDDAHVQH